MGFLLVFACLFCVGAATIPGHGFLPNQEYHFEWLGRLTSGVPELATQLAGIGLKTHFVIVPQDSTEVLVKVLDVKQVEINDKFEYLPIDEELDLTYKTLTSEQMALVTKPFLVKLQGGKVVYIQVEPEVPDWLLNIRKGFLSFYTITPYQGDYVPETFNEIESTYRTNPFYYYKNLKKPFYFQQYNTPLHYTIMEEGIYGECETQYSVSPVAEYMLNKTMEFHFKTIEKPENHFIITKTVNFDKCTKLVAFSHRSPVYKNIYGHNKSQKTRTSTSLYVVEGDLQKYVLKYAYSYGQHLFQPIGISNEQQLDVTTMHFVKLVDVKPLSTHYKLPQHLVTVYDLMYKFPKKFYQSVSLFESPLRYFFEQFHHDVGTYLIDDIIKNIEYVRSDEIKSKPAFIQSLVYSLQNLHFSEIKTLYEKLSGRPLEIETFITPHHKEWSSWSTPKEWSSWSTPKEWSSWAKTDYINTPRRPFKQPIHDAQTQTRLNLLVDLLAMTGNNPSFTFINTLILNGHIKGEKAAQTFMVYPLTIQTPTPELIQSFIHVLKTVEDDDILLGAGILAVSNIVHDYCVEEKSRFHYPSEKFVPYCHPQHPVVYDVLSFLADVPKSKYLNFNRITALGNLGVVEAIPYLKPYIYGYNVDDVEIRQTAIYALRTILKHQPKLIVEILLPVYKNVADTYEVRKAALTTILIANPEFSVFQEIAAYTWIDPTYQIHSYIYSFFKTAMEIEFDTPFFTEIKYKSKKAFELTKPVKYGVLSSYIKVFSKMFHDINEGVMVTFDLTDYENGIFPSQFYFGLKQLFGDVQYDSYEFKFFLHGLSKFFQEQYGQKSFSKYGYIDNAVWFKKFGGMERYITIKTLMKSLDISDFSIVHLMEKLQHGFDFLKVLPETEFVSVLPTDLGVPIFINAHSPKYLSFKGKFSGFNSQQVTFDFIPHFEQESHFHTYLINPLSKKMIGAAVKVHNKIQTPVKVGIDTKFFSESRHLSYSLTIPKEHEFQIIKEVVPLTFYKTFDFKPFYYKDNEYHVIKKFDYVYKKEHLFGKDLFGLQFKTGYKSDRPNNNLNQYNFFTLLTEYFVAPTSWNYHHYYFVLDHQQSTTHVINLDTVTEVVEKQITKKNYVFKFEGQETHVFDILYQQLVDPFNIYEKNVTLKVHQTHPTGKPYSFIVQYVINYPEVDILKSNVDLTAKGYFEVLMGYETSPKSIVNLRFKLEQTPEQQKFARNSYDYKKCHQDKSYNLIYSHYCLASLLKHNTFDKYTFETVYDVQEIPSYFYYYFNTFYDIFKYNYYTYSTVHYPTTNLLKTGNVNFHFKYHPFYNTWDFKFIKPTEEIFFSHIPEVPYFDYVVPRYVQHPLIYLAQNQFINYPSVPYCLLQDKYITTFDNITYPLTDVKPDCYRVVLKQCYDHTSKFFVLSKFKHGVHQVKVVFDEQTELLLTPTTGNYVKFTLNGVEQVLPVNKKKEFSLKTVKGRFPVYGGHMGHSFTVLDFPMFTIYHDGKNFWIEVSKVFKNQLCGICGNFNGEYYDEYYTSHTCIHESRVEFLNSWIYPDGTCTIPKIQNKKQCHIPRTVPTVEALYHVKYTYPEKEICREFQQNVIVYKHKACVSVEQLPYCKPECSALFLKPKKAPFYCAATTSDIKNIIDQVYNGHYVDLTKYPFTYLDVSYPDICLQH